MTALSRGKRGGGCAPKGARWLLCKGGDLSGRSGVLGDGLGALRDGVLGELTGEDETSGSLDLAGGDGGLARELGEPGGLESDLLKGVVDKRVHDRHGALGHTAVGVDLLEDLVDVRRVRLHRLLAAPVVGPGPSTGLVAQELLASLGSVNHSVVAMNSHF